MDTSRDNRPIHISVVIPAYNIEQYIDRAIKSVLGQTRRPDEIIVIDDGSTDSTADKIAAYGNQVRYLYQKNRGLSGARNTGIRESRFDWIAFLDGDDEWMPEYLAMQVAVLKNNPDLKWSGGNFMSCLCEENRRGPFADPNELKKKIQNRDYFPNYFLAFNQRASGHPNTIIIHKKVFDTVGLFNEKQAFAEDLEMWWRIAFEFPKFGYIVRPVAVYHMQRPGTLSEEFKKTRLRWLTELVEKNLQMAVQKDMHDVFAPIVRRLVMSWIRGMFFENRPQEIRDLLNRFDRYLPFRFKVATRCLIVCPGATAVICRLISKIVRRLKLRKQIVRPPS